MKQLILKCGLYAIIIIILLELYVRVFHLSKDYPVRIVDAQRVEKWQPNQNGYAVTGNRRQNFSEYRINSSGFNSYHEFNPTADKFELALVGDSFIEGFHQNYYNSIGKKIENTLKGVEVYEYGYAGYDFADQIHLIHAYKDDFELIDCVVLNLKFENDLMRGTYDVIPDRMKFESPLYRNLRNIKLLTYAQNIGALDPIKKLPGKIINALSGQEEALSKSEISKTPKQTEEILRNQKYLNNFVQLVTTYGYDKDKNILLLDATKTPSLFLDYLSNNQYKYIDYSKILQASKKPTNLVYDMHWNNHGRTLIAKAIVDYVVTKFQDFNQ